MGASCDSNFSFGYGLSATALQLASAYSVLADNGIRKPVSLLKLSDEAVIDLPRQQVLSPEITANLRKMLRTVVDADSGGSALEANVLFILLLVRLELLMLLEEKVMKKISIIRCL